MASATSFTMAVIQLLVWNQQRTNWAYLLFACMAIGAGANALIELKLLFTTSIEEYGFWMRWEGLALYAIVISLVWSVFHFFGTGRPWLAWTITAIWSIGLIFNFTNETSVAFEEIHGLKHVTTWNEVKFTVAEATPHPWTVLQEFTVALILAFVADAAWSRWRRGARLPALRLGGSIILFMILAGIHTPLVDRGYIQTPYMVGFAFLAIAIAMGYEVADAAARAHRLHRKIRVAEGRWRSLLEGVDLVVISLDARWEITYVNPCFLGTTGYHLSDLEKLTAKDLLTEQGRNQLLNQKHLIETKHQAPAGEWGLVCADGSSRMIAWSTVALQTGQGDFDGVIAIGADITDRKQAEAQSRELVAQLAEAQEMERARISRELHDDISQRLARLAIDVARIQQEQTSPPFAGFDTQLNNLCADVTKVAYRLHPSVLQDLGLQEALQTEAEYFTRDHGLPVATDLQTLPRPVPLPVAIGLFRIAQEALRNVARHSEANHVRITLQEFDAGIRMVIADDGRGFNPSDRDGAPHLGLKSMQERITLLEGELDIDSQHGQGVTIMAWVPFPAEAS